MNLQELREENGYSQRELSSQMKEHDEFGQGVSVTAISKWENGVFQPSLKSARLLSRVYDVGLERIMDCVENTATDEA